VVGLAGGMVAVGCGPEDYTFVPPAPGGHCENRLFEPARGETDLDCGGLDCRGCELGFACVESGDCLDGECLDGYCQNPGCDNLAQDGTETDIDCGGDCKPCTPGQICEVPRDCDSSICGDDLRCVGATCSDEVQNGDETARDCGGGMCDGCPPGSPCLVPTDCTSGVCDAETMRCVVFCSPGTDECDLDLTVECETNLLTSPDHCGGCNMPCEFDNGIAGCAGGSCELQDCVAPWVDCNSDPDDGCETDTSSSATSCGACGSECPDINGTPTCEDSACGISCDDGFEDCDEDAANGCERGVGNDVLHCGACNNECPEDEGHTAYCVDGECGQTECDPGLGDCDGDPDNGCEEDLATDPENCGRCGGLCSVAHGTAGCDAELGCIVAGCEDGWANCNEGNPDGGYADGCEVNTDESAEHCGACGTVCEVEGGTGRCMAGDCTVGDCDDGFGDCDGSYDNGCEVNTFTDKDNCGGCGTSGLQCDTVFPNATGSCVSGGCEIDDCLGSFQDCTAAAGCETNVSSSDLHCGACGAACEDVGGTNSCSGGSCMLSCDATHASCDTNTANGCETATTGSGAVTHCGGCTTSCSSAGATSTTCNGSGVCAPTCDATHASCDSNPTNGCETATTGAGNEAHCGGCSPCSTSGASSVACNGSGTCVPTCNNNRLNCNTSNDGCEVTQGTSNCGVCGRQCLFGAGNPRHSTASTCMVNGAASVCQPTCEVGWGACSNPQDGCSSSLSTPSNCGVCGRVCASGTANCVLTGSTYNCQATLSFSGESHGSVVGNDLTVTHNVVSALNTNRLLLVGVIAGSFNPVPTTPGTGLAQARPDAVTMDGTPMTFFGESDGDGGLGISEYRQAHLFYYYLLDSALGGTGNKNIRVNAATAPSPNHLVVSVALFNGVRQTSPLFTETSAKTVRTTATDITSTITLDQSGSAIYSIATAYYSGNVPLTQPPNSNLISTMNSSSSAGRAIGDEGGTVAVAGYRAPGTPLMAGDFTVGWRYLFLQKGFQFLVAIAPATQ